MEIWKDVPEFEGKYQVSNLGRVRSLPRFVKRGLAKTDAHPVKGKIRKLAKDKKGYNRVGLCSDGVLTTHKVHRLVAKCFIENPRELPQVNHKNGIKDDNRVENLEWCNNSQNQIHAYSKGLNTTKSGAEHCRASLTDEQVEEIRATEKYYGMFVKLANKFGVHPDTISNVYYKKHYK